MDTLKFLDLFEKERAALREELHNLKGCQITFLTSTVTATGVLLGLSNALKTKPIGTLWFLPLVIIIPFWWIFFDKATTITRIVGYYRMLEAFILGDLKPENFKGWENSLSKFRETEIAERELLPGTPWLKRIVNFFNMLVFRTGHKYWIIANYVFFGLAATCLVLGVNSSGFSTIGMIGISFVTLSLVWQLFVVYQLIYGHHSYNTNYDIWYSILKAVPPALPTSENVLSSGAV